MKKLLCLLLVLILLPAAACAKDNASDIRVLLRRLNLTDRADMTLSGRWLVRSASGMELLLSDGVKVTVRAENRQLILYAGGVTAAMGTKVSFLRQESGDTVPGIRFNLQAGFYPGDLTLTLENESLVPILTLPLETYLKGVVPYEMGDSFPEEALKAQAVCARTYAMSRMVDNRDSAWDVVDTTNDQVFKGLHSSSPKSE